MVTLVTALYVLSGALPVAAIVWIWARNVMRKSTVEAERAAILADYDALTIKPDAGVGHRATYRDRQTSFQDGELAILRAALADLKGPALLTVGGVIAGTVASVWSLHL